MGGHDDLAVRFERHRERLLAVAFRLLGSLGEAEDAVQETWLRLQRSGDEGVANLGGWLTTVVSRICLDALRSRAARRELPAGRRPPDMRDPNGVDPEREALLADAVGRALLVVLDRLTPAERIAFVLHDVLGIHFDQIAPVLERSTATTKKLASRARQRLRGAPIVDGSELARQRRVAEAFLAAARAGDVAAIMAVLAPDVVRRADPAALPQGRATEIRGARSVSEEIRAFGRDSRFAEPALVGGAVGVVVAPLGRIRLAIVMAFEGGRIASYELVAEPASLERLELAALDLWGEPGVPALRVR